MQENKMVERANELRKQVSTYFNRSNFSIEIKKYIDEHKIEEKTLNNW